MTTRTEMTERWLQYAASKTDREDVFLAGIGIVNDHDNAEYYARVGLDCLLRAAYVEVDGLESTIPKWIGGVRPTKY